MVPCFHVIHKCYNVFDGGKINNEFPIALMCRVLLKLKLLLSSMFGPGHRSCHVPFDMLFISLFFLSLFHQSVSTVRGLTDSNRTDTSHFERSYFYTTQRSNKTRTTLLPQRLHGNNWMRLARKNLWRLGSREGEGVRSTTNLVCGD